MRRKLLTALILVNALLAGAVLTSPAATQMMTRGLFDCCKGGAAESEEEYCCYECCWLITNCRSDKDCQVEVEKKVF